MPEGWVFDSSPLIVLGKIHALDLVAHLTGVKLIPAQVVSEIMAGPASDEARKWIKSKRCPAKKADILISPLVGGWDIGDGEAAVITCAKSRPKMTAVLDDRLARACASSLEVPVAGTIGLLLWLKKHGTILSVKTYVNRMAATNFRLADHLIREALGLAGE